jgi:hypothetical protein
MYAGQSSFNESSVPLFENDKYILKTQVVPPVCPTCPGLCSAPYSAANKPKNTSSNVATGSVSGQNSNVVTGSVSGQNSNIATGSVASQNSNVAPHLNAQREFNQSNNDYNFGPNSLTNNNLDNYEPQSVLNDFSKF